MSSEETVKEIIGWEEFDGAGNWRGEPTVDVSMEQLLEPASPETP